MNTTHQAALRLAAECASQPLGLVIPPDPAEQASAASETMGEHPLLIEGHAKDGTLDVLMPNGETWKYLLPLESMKLFRRVVLVCIDQRDSYHAACFRPCAEGLHPFVGTATRYAVEGRAGA